MGVAWNRDRPDNHGGQELHYLSSYRTREDAILRVSPSTSTSSAVKERLFISNEDTKITPSELIDYLMGIIENTDKANTPDDIAVFICGTPVYSQMIKDCCAITSVKSYEW